MNRIGIPPELRVPELEKPSFPEPKASPIALAAWWDRVRIGALLGFVYELGGIAMALCWLGGMKFTWNSIASGVSIIIMVVSAWLLVSAEPKNWKWLRVERWLLRTVATVLAILYISFLVAIQFRRPISENGFLQSYNSFSDIFYAFYWLMWFVLFRYLRVLVARLQDKLLRKNFSVLMWLVGIIEVLYVLSLACNTHWMATGGGSASRPSTSSPSSFVVYFILGVLLVSCGWPAWLMWRLASRAKAAAEACRKVA